MGNAIRYYVIAVAISLTIAAGSSTADEPLSVHKLDEEKGVRSGRFCTTAALLQFSACKNEVADDNLTARAFCTNVSDDQDREDCLQEARSTQADDGMRCHNQLRARRDLCQKLGEGRYDPDLDPDLFDDDVANPTSPNPYFPLTVGNKWTFEGGDNEVSTDEVLDKTKLIEGVTCLVVRNVASRGGRIIEVTDDWYGLRKNRDVNYCGEQVQNFETFAGDDPAEPELIDTGGSFKAGRQAMPGLIFPGFPTVGLVYRQEWAPGDAEDVAEVVSINYGFGADRKLDEHMLPALAKLLCSNDCVVTRDYSPIEPGAFAFKFYARGLGMFYEVAVDEEGNVEVFQLVACNFDARCSRLPAP